MHLIFYPLGHLVHSVVIPELLLRLVEPLQPLQALLLYLLFGVQIVLVYPVDSLNYHYFLDHIFYLLRPYESELALPDRLNLGHRPQLAPVAKESYAGLLTVLGANVVAVLQAAQQLVWGIDSLDGLTYGLVVEYDLGAGAGHAGLEGYLDALLGLAPGLDQLHDLLQVQGYVPELVMTAEALDGSEHALYFFPLLIVELLEQQELLGVLLHPEVDHVHHVGVQEGQHLLLFAPVMDLQLLVLLVHFHIETRHYCLLLALGGLADSALLSVLIAGLYSGQPVFF